MLLASDYKTLSLPELETEIREMEDVYAQAFIDAADAAVLSLLWQQIKEIQNEIIRRING